MNGWTRRGPQRARGPACEPALSPGLGPYCREMTALLPSLPSKLHLSGASSTLERGRAGGGRRVSTAAAPGLAGWLDRLRRPTVLP